MSVGFFMVVNEPFPTVEQALGLASSRSRVRVGTLALVLWCSLVTGFAELAIFVGRRNLGAGSHVLYGMSHHFPWMIPASSLMIFAVFGLLVAMVARVHPRLSSLMRNYGLLFLSSLTILLTIRGLSAPASLLLAGGFAARGMPWLKAERVARRLRVGIRLTLPLLIGAWVGLVVLGPGGDYWKERQTLKTLPRAVAGAPNVLLVVMDTVRADRLSAFGYTRETTPNLSRLAARGVRFSQAITPAPWTLPAHASMFTGRWAHETATLWGKPLERGVPTLAEFLASHGYATAGFVANHFNCSRESGLARGFAHYEDFDISPVSTLGSSGLGWLVVKAVAMVRTELRRDSGLEPSVLLTRGFRRKDAPRINQDALRWLDANAKRPFFVFLNYFDAHDPFLLPEGGGHHFGLQPSNRAETELLRDWLHVDKQKLTAHQVSLASDSYDDCIAYLDHHLGRLFDELERRGLRENTIVVVTSDHGEEFGEHGLFGHGVSLYQGEAHVPLLVMDPRSASAGTVYPNPVSLRDLPVTMADLTGLQASSRFSGSSLARFWQPHSESAVCRDVPVLSEVEESGLVKATHGVVTEIGAKSITMPEGVYHRLVDGQEQYYNLHNDPWELHNLSNCPTAQPSILKSREILGRIIRHEPGEVAGRYEH